MSARQLTALGTASQVPTRQRNHNGYLLEWDGEGFLFDPGEGTQRQMARAGQPASRIHRVLITHFHGDHCLGLASMVQRFSLDRCAHPIHVHYPSDGQEYFDRLCNASIYHHAATIVAAPLEAADELTPIVQADSYTLYSHRLDHSVTTVGYRLEEAPRRTLVPDRLAAAGVVGPDIARLCRDGFVEVRGQRVALDDVSVPHKAQVFAFVMDTRRCAGADALARGADLLVMEATFAEADRDRADEYRHSTASDAAHVARQAGVRVLAITHFSQRYSSVEPLLREARAIFPDTIALHDLQTVAIERPKRWDESG